MFYFKDRWRIVNQYHVQTLITFYLHRISLSWDLFIVFRSVLKRAFSYKWKWTSMFGSSWNISRLVFGHYTDVLISWWIVDALRHFALCLKGLLKGFLMYSIASEIVEYSWSYSQMKFVILPFLLVWALLRSYLVFGILWRYLCSFLPEFCRFFSGSYISSPWIYSFYLIRYLFFLCLCCKSRIFSTSHSSWPCIKVGGEGIDFFSQMVDSEYCTNLLA